MNKPEFIDAIAAKTTMPKKTVAEMLEAQEQIIAATLAAGEEITIPGVGKLLVATMPARKARNPRTGETLHMPERKAVKMRLSTGLKAVVAK